MPKLEMKVTTSLWRYNAMTGVALSVARLGERVISYYVCDVIHNETLDFPADQREEAIKTFEQMRQRKV